MLSRVTKRYLILILAILVLASSMVGCTEETTTYYHREFGYSVEMPKSWEVVEKPVFWITGTLLQNTVGFNSEAEDIFKVDWVTVKVESAKFLWDIGDVGLSDGLEYKVYKYGYKGYIVESRSLWRQAAREWMVTYYIKHDNKLYTITYNNEGTFNKVRVSIDGYGELKTNPPQ